MTQQKSPQDKWNQIIFELEHTVDGIGGHLDPAIVETVTGLIALGFYTTASCEGHLDHGTAGPWIDIESPTNTDEVRNKAIETIEEAQKNDSDELFETAHKLFSAAEQPHLEERKKLIDLLSEFYLDRHVSYDVRLHVQTWGGDASRLENQGLSIQKISPENVRQQKLSEYQEEMKQFGDFLKKKFFSL